MFECTRIQTICVNTENIIIILYLLLFNLIIFILYSSS